ncbi:MAG: PKD domain-containing protein, partial [Candidatus Eisenbacteria bacterium]|nr:PKD domain-containing protein [Candidatus Eisenbacteria bacterium]
MRSSSAGRQPNQTSQRAWAAIFLLVLLGSMVPQRGAGAAETSLRLASDPDDPIGQGIEFQMGIGIANFTMWKTGEMVTVEVDPAGPGDVWTIEFEAAGGAPLGPGFYSNAGGIPADMTGPGLHISTATRRCAEVRGTFELRQLDLDNVGNPIRLRALFEQHCEGQAPALRGEICVEADVPLRIEAPRIVRTPRGEEAFLIAFLMDELWRTGPLSAGGLPAAAIFTDFGDNTATLSWFTTLDDVGRHPITLTGTVAGVTESVPAVLDIQGDNRLILTSEPGEPLAGGNALDANGNSGWFWATEDASGLEIEFADWFGDTWSIRMAGAGGVPLAEGFAGATGGADAFLEIRHNGLTAASGEGSLSVRELRHDGQGYLESVRAAFEHRPTGGGPALFGEVSFNSRVTVSLRVPARLDLAAGETVAFTATADDVRGGIPTLSVSGLPAGAAFVDRGDGTAELNWNTPAGIESMAEVIITATADDGRFDQATIRIAVTVPNAAPMAEAGGPYAGTTDVALALDSSGSGDPDFDVLTFAWDFGDGQTSTDPNPSHVWSTAGSYLVRLTVNDGQASAADSAAVTIADPLDESVKARAFLTGP